MSDITINVKAPSVNVNATPQSNVIAPKMQMIRGGSVTVDDELSLTSENPVQNKVVTAALNEKADIITDTASGAIASFPDGADGLPVKSLVCNIEPVQDLHGYDSPWPAGGGKNKAGPMEQGTVQESRSEGSTYSELQIQNTTRIRSIDLIPIGDNGQAIVSFNGSVYKVAIAGFDSDGLYLGRASGFRSFQSTSPQTINWTNARYIVVILAKQDNSEVTDADRITAQLQVEVDTTTATDYAPYSNICPISGWTGANIYQEAVYDESATPKLSISWEPEAGTVYGGTLAINQDGSCDLTVADANIASYNGETLPSTWISDRDVYAEGTTPTIGAQVVYKLATPTVYHLPFVTMLKTLLGTNNIWADIGDVEVKYPADTKLYIDNLIASLSS